MGFIIQWLCYLVAFATGSAVAWVIVTMSMAAGAAPPDRAANETTELIALADEPETVVLPGLADEADTAVLPRSTETEKH